ncbi:MAG: HD domain-containing protein [Ignisphaera sp.]|nr:HD domain-containing protein [Ignisphaera sp.]MCX8168005.1 HD domain-containing protein [Ignisphaera sp.]MDW8085524.1 HD domain-containing protein [Ignisphaera sp.]
MIRFAFREASRMHSVKRIYDEVHGYIELSEVELKIVESTVFQRLRFIKQLAAAWYVYPGATHTRFSHSLGAMHIMGLVASRLIDLGYVHSVDDVQLLRLAALLHDIGHTPFSHAIEPFYKHRLGVGHEDLSKIVILESSSIREVLSSYGYDPKTIAALLEGRYREPLYNQLLSSDVDVDRMDYLLRDALHTGVAYGSIDLQRIIATLVVDGEGNLAILDKGIDALENFYLARLHMYRTVYYHKTLVGYEMMLRKIYEYMNDYAEDPLLPKSREDIVRIARSGEIVLWHDDWFLGMMIDMYRKGRCRELKELIEAFFSRKGYKVVVDRSRFDMNPIDIEGDRDIVVLREIISSVKGRVEPHQIALFVDDIKILDEDPYIAPRVIVDGRASVPIVDVENSVVRSVPRRYHIKRLYVISSRWQDVKDYLAVRGL